MTEKDALLLLRGEDPTSAATAEAMLWSIWCQSGEQELDFLMRSGIEAMQSGNFAEAETLFSRIIERAPAFAEGWNKRATVRYLRKDFAGSIADCQETLTRNPNHFGASAGQGLCHLSRGEYREAAICFRRALEIHPHLEAVRQNLAFAQFHDNDGGFLH